jgi:hypothetical protein
LFWQEAFTDPTEMGTPPPLLMMRQLSMTQTNPATLVTHLAGDRLFSMVTGLVFGVFLWTKAGHAEDKPDFQSDLTQFKPQDYQRPFAPRAPWNLPLQGIPHHPESGLWAERLWRLSTAARPGNFNLGGFENYSYSVYLADEATAFVPGQGEASGLRQPARKGSAVDAITKKTAADYKTQTGVDAAIFASSPTAGATVIKG